jgi:hypothetical protein
MNKPKGWLKKILKKKKKKQNKTQKQKNTTRTDGHNTKTW